MMRARKRMKWGGITPDQRIPVLMSTYKLVRRSEYCRGDRLSNLQTPLQQTLNITPYIQ